MHAAPSAAPEAAETTPKLRVVESSAHEEAEVLQQSQILEVINAGSDKPEDAVEGIPGAMIVQLRQDLIAAVKPIGDNRYEVINKTNVTDAFTD